MSDIIPMDHWTPTPRRLIDAVTGSDLGPATPDQQYAGEYSRCILIGVDGGVIEPGGRGSATARVAYLR